VAIGVNQEGYGEKRGSVAGDLPIGWVNPNPWRKSSLCGSSSCIEVAQLRGGVAIRDSKESEGPVLRYTSDEWKAFVAGVKAGEFDDIVG
jgi:hypothetical protein